MRHGSCRSCWPLVACCVTATPAPGGHPNVRSGGSRLHCAWFWRSWSASAGCAVPGAGQSGPQPRSSTKARPSTSSFRSRRAAALTSTRVWRSPPWKRLCPARRWWCRTCTGAGGIVGSNQIYRAAPDGLTIGIGNIGGLAFAAATGVEGVQYDLGKYTWLGRVYAEPRVIVCRPRGASTRRRPEEAGPAGPDLGHRRRLRRLLRGPGAVQGPGHPGQDGHRLQRAARVQPGHPAR